MSNTEEVRGIWLKKPKVLPKPVQSRVSGDDTVKFEIDPASMQELMSGAAWREEEGRGGRRTIGGSFGPSTAFSSGQVHSPKSNASSSSRRASLYGGAMRVRAPADQTNPNVSIKRTSSLMTPSRVISKPRAPYSASSTVKTPRSRIGNQGHQNGPIPTCTIRDHAITTSQDVAPQKNTVYMHSSEAQQGLCAEKATEHSDPKSPLPDLSSTLSSQNPVTTPVGSHHSNSAPLKAFPTPKAEKQSSFPSIISKLTSAPMTSLKPTDQNKPNATEDPIPVTEATKLVSLFPAFEPTVPVTRPMQSKDHSASHTFAKIEEGVKVDKAEKIELRMASAVGPPLPPHSEQGHAASQAASVPSVSAMMTPRRVMAKHTASIINSTASTSTKKAHSSTMAWKTPSRVVAKKGPFEAMPVEEGKMSMSVGPFNAASTPLTSLAKVSSVRKQEMPSAEEALSPSYQGRKGFVFKESLKWSPADRSILEDGKKDGKKDGVVEKEKIVLKGFQSEPSLALLRPSFSPKAAPSSVFSPHGKVDLVRGGANLAMEKRRSEKEEFDFPSSHLPFPPSPPSSNPITTTNDGILIDDSESSNSVRGDETTTSVDATSWLTTLSSDHQLMAENDLANESGRGLLVDLLDFSKLDLEFSQDFSSTMTLGASSSSLLTLPSSLLLPPSSSLTTSQDFFSDLFGISSSSSPSSSCDSPSKDSHSHQVIEMAIENVNTSTSEQVESAQLAMEKPSQKEASQPTKESPSTSEIPTVERSNQSSKTTPIEVERSNQSTKSIPIEVETSNQTTKSTPIEVETSNQTPINDQTSTFSSSSSTAIGLTERLKAISLERQSLLCQLQRLQEEETSLLHAALLSASQASSPL